MEIAYCERWWLSHKQPIRSFDEETARSRHHSRKPYVALLGGKERPRFIVDIADKWVSVDFMDQQLRKYLSYNFKELNPGRLFLKSAYYWEYEGDTGKEVSSKIFNFSIDGYTVVADRNVAADETREFEITTSVEENWRAYPEFGDYAALCVEDRTPSR